MYQNHVNARKNSVWKLSCHLNSALQLPYTLTVVELLFSIFWQSSFLHLCYYLYHLCPPFRKNTLNHYHLLIFSHLLLSKQKKTNVVPKHNKLGAHPCPLSASMSLNSTIFLPFLSAAYTHKFPIWLVKISRYLWFLRVETCSFRTHSLYLSRFPVHLTCFRTLHTGAPR